MRIVAAALALAAPLAPALAGQDFGTREEARALAQRLVAIIDADGIQAAVEAIYDPSQPFVATRMGVNLFQGSTVIGDNREPETVAADYSGSADLTGEPVWPRVSDAAARGGDDAVLKWYHYDTQEVYDFHCFAMRAERDDGHVMVCR
jgi:hypothetical protein